MKKLILALSLILLAGSARAQTAAEVLPPRQRAIFAQRRDIIMRRLMLIVTSDPARCAAVLTAAGIADQTVCK